MRCLNNDGIDICNTRDVLVEDCFVRSEDDCIAIKGLGYAGNQAVDNVLVRRTSLWNDRAHVWRIGAECRAEAFRNLTFKDIQVLHYMTSYGSGSGSGNSGDDLPTCISLQPDEDMPIENVLFEDIQINHEGQEWVIEVVPKATPWAKKTDTGNDPELRVQECLCDRRSPGQLRENQGPRSGRGTLRRKRPL